MLFHGACQQHDYCYLTSIPKLICDARFFSQMTPRCDAFGDDSTLNVEQQECLATAGVYSVAVIAGADAEYAAAQQERVDKFSCQ